MLANDGAEVYSFDEAGCQRVVMGSVMNASTTRAEALSQSDIVITGVPDAKFPLIEGQEIKESAHCINFSSVKNFAESAKQKCAVYIPRVGPMTVTMVMRNTLRLGFYQNLGLKVS
jgi:methylenetetrahydrofolate dehydrogenase (NADP+)/methenyltetrahydrofolate cyclohydrolase